MRVSRHTLRLTTAACLVALTTLAACGKKAEQAPAAPPPPTKVGVVTIQPQQYTLNNELPGRTSAYVVAEVRPQVGGVIQKRLFTEGTDVKAGQQLYQINPEVLQASLESARASLARAEANVVATSSRAKRYQELVAINAISKQEFDDTSATLKQNQADVASARAAVESARINLAYTKVTAPISGRIGMSTVTQGALVTANQTAALTTIHQLDPIYVDLSQSSTQLLKLRRDLASGKLQDAGDNSARVRLVLEDGTVFGQEGKLQFASVAVDPTTSGVTMRAVFPNPKQELLPGMFVRARLTEAVDDNALLVPQQGVTRDQKGRPTAMIVNAENKVEIRQLEAGQAVGDKWVIQSGLKAGDRVIVEGVQRVKAGATVEAVPAAIAAPGAGAPAAAPGAPAAAPAPAPTK
jgi:membrane fusion protein (multidrug efflux system)